MSNWIGGSTTTTIDIYNAYEYGAEGNVSSLSALFGEDSDYSPMMAFACLAAYYAGQEETKLTETMNEYTAQHTSYVALLEKSEEASTCKGVAASDGECAYSGTFAKYIVTGDENSKEWIGGVGVVTHDEWLKITSKKSSCDEETWEDICSIIDKEKDIQSTELNKLSTEMELCVEDSSEAQEMAANAVKKLSDLVSTQAKSAGG